MTTTTNIHSGLAAWTNHTFTLAERCSTGGNAYQCIIVGTSTSAPTGTTSDVDNGGAAHFKWLSAIDFTSVQAWINGWPGTLIDDLVGQVWNNGTITTTVGTPFLNTGSHTMSGFTATLTPAPGEGIRDSVAQNSALQFDTTKGVSFTTPNATGSTPYFVISDVGVVLDGLQVTNPDSTSAVPIVQCQAGSRATIRNCIFDGFGQSGAPMVNMNDIGVVTNCLFIDRQAVGGAGSALQFVAGTGSVVVNATLHSTTSNTGGFGIIQGGTATGTVIRNVACTGYATPFAAGAGTMTADHSLISAASLHASVTNGGSNLVSKTAANQFVSATADFRLKIGADCINAATPDLTDIATNDDIARTQRPNIWDIGAWELVQTWFLMEDSTMPVIIPVKKEMVSY